MPSRVEPSKHERVPLSRERVLRAAITLADEGGIKALSMRRLAQELGVEAMSLYNHVASKDDIVGGIVELVAGEIDLVSDEADWKTAVRRRAVSAHQTLLRHPWAAGLWMSTTSVGTERLRFSDCLLRGFREGGFTPELTYHAFHVLQSHVLGYSLYAAGLSFDTAELEEMAASFLRDFPADAYPDLAEHVRQHMEPSDEQAGAFEFGLDLILDGLERRRDMT
jgi:AcrR family transcriptional regulator